VNPDKKLECGWFDVPLDYGNPEGDKISLKVSRYKSENATLGTLFVNPGGPGESGVEYVADFGAIMSTWFGGHYNIVGWFHFFYVHARTHIDFELQVGIPEVKCDSTITNLLMRSNIIAFRDKP